MGDLRTTAFHPSSPFVPSIPSLQLIELSGMRGSFLLSSPSALFYRSVRRKVNCSREILPSPSLPSFSPPSLYFAFITNSDCKLGVESQASFLTNQPLPYCTILWRTSNHSTTICDTVLNMNTQLWNFYHFLINSG